jgi:ketosteroid isomerase-like protein
MARSLGSAPEVVWEGLVPGVECRDRDAVRQMLEGSIRESRDVDHLELTAGAQRVVLGVRSPRFEELAGVTLNGELFNVFTIEGGRIVRVRDFADPHEAHRAAGVGESIAGQSIAIAPARARSTGDRARERRPSRQPTSRTPSSSRVSATTRRC